jgi:hypothetical protein
MIQLEPEDLKEFIPPLIKEPGYAQVFSLVPVSVYQKNRHFLCDKTYWLEVFRHDLLVLADEVARIELKYPGLVNKSPWQDLEQEEGRSDFDTAFDIACIKKALKKAIDGASGDTVEKYSSYRTTIEAWERNRYTPYPDLDPAFLNVPGIQEALRNDSDFKQHLLEKVPVGGGTIEDNGNVVENYFILDGDYWKVRFNGSKEHIVGAKAPIKTLVEYLRNRDTIQNPSQVYGALHGSIPEETSKECNLMPKAFASGLNRDSTKILTATKIQQYEEILSEMIERKNLFHQQGKIEDAETLEEEIEKFLATLKAEYGVKFDGKTGELITANRTAKGRDSAAENTQIHIKRAIEILKHVEGLPEHIEKYLLNNKNIYQPPQDFPKWIITD